MSTSQEQDLAARAVELVGGALSGAEVAALADHHRHSLTRFATSVIHQNVAEDVTTLRLTVHHAGRTASTSASVVGDADLPALVERVVAAVDVAPLDPGWPGLAPVADGPDLPAPDPGTAGATPADRAEAVRAFVEGAGGLETAGYCRTNHWTGAFASSSGQQLAGDAAECGFAGVARDAGADGVAREMPVRLGDLDAHALGARAAAKARAWTDPVELPPGRYEVVLEPDAVLDVVSNLAVWSFSGRAVTERSSFVRVGEDQFDPAVTLVDEPLALGLGFDAEGTPRDALTLVDGGRTTAVTHDRRTALEAGATSTGHSQLGWLGVGPSARHASLRPSVSADAVATEVDGPAADSSVAELVGQVERGILVTDFWYTRVLDPRTLSITGLTRNGVWLVEDGQVTRPVRNFRFTQAYAEALAPGQVLGVGATARPIPGDTYSALAPRYTVPALRLASWNFTGGASG